MNSTNQTLPHQTTGEVMKSLMNELCRALPTLAHPDELNMICYDSIDTFCEDVAYYIYDSKNGWNQWVDEYWGDTWRSVHHLDITPRQHQLMVQEFDINLPHSWITLKEPFSESDEDYDDDEETEEENCAHLLDGGEDKRNQYRKFATSIEHEIVDRINSRRPTTTDDDAVEECEYLLWNTIEDKNSEVYKHTAVKHLLECARFLINIDIYETPIHMFQEYIQNLKQMKNAYRVDKNNELYLRYLFVIHNVNPLIEYLTSIVNRKQQYNY